MFDVHCGCSGVHKGLYLLLEESTDTVASGDFNDVLKLKECEEMLSS